MKKIKLKLYREWQLSLDEDTGTFHAQKGDDALSAPKLADIKKRVDERIKKMLNFVETAVFEIERAESTQDDDFNKIGFEESHLHRGRLTSFNNSSPNEWEHRFHVVWDDNGKQAPNRAPFLATDENLVIAAEIIANNNRIAELELANEKLELTLKRFDPETVQ